jgi:hypothetical protein
MKEQGPNKWTLIRSPTWSGRDPQEKFLPFTFRPDAGPTIRTLALRLVLHYESALRHTLPLRNSANLAPPLSSLREQTLSLLPFKVCVNDKLLSSFFWQASLAQAIEIMLRVLGDHEGCEGPLQSHQSCTYGRSAEPRPPLCKLRLPASLWHHGECEDQLAIENVESGGMDRVRGTSAKTYRRGPSRMSPASCSR